MIISLEDVIMAALKTYIRTSSQPEAELQFSTILHLLTSDLGSEFLGLALPFGDSVFSLS